ncbi:MAG: hypothetical protein K9K93_02855, partial [Acholeplasmataceae bacterium]|nr:hypothetical protein [Acholeplasmataceae bacterium]
MKYLILLEGNTEKAFIELMMDKGMLKIDALEMLDLRPHQKRQIDPSLQVLIRQLPPDEKVKIIKIGDTLTDQLKIPKDIRHKIASEEKYCTKPEFEMVVIISEGMYEAYQKVKSQKRPKIFAKERIKHHGTRYTNSQKWIIDYFSENNLINALREYKRRT